MDYYTRKARAQSLIKNMFADKKSKFSDQEISFAVEDQFQLSQKWALTFLEKLRGNQ